MRNLRADDGKEQSASPECRHYWVIENATGPVSKGICKFCSAQKEFSNYLSDMEAQNIVLFDRPLKAPTGLVSPEHSDVVPVRMRSTERKSGSVRYR
jgi:hypothetical protein